MDKKRRGRVGWQVGLKRLGGKQESCFLRQVAFAVVAVFAVRRQVAYLGS